MSDWPVNGVPLLSQTAQLVFLCVRLRSWRFLGSIALIISLVSNNFLQLDYNRSAQDNRLRHLHINASYFVKENVILVSSHAEEREAITKALKELVNTSFPSDWYKACTSTYECGVKHIEKILTEPSSYFGLIDYLNRSSSRLPNVVCHLAYGSELHCPFLSYYAYGSVWGSRLDSLRSVEVFRLLDTVPEDKDKLHTMDPPACSTSAMYPMLFPQILTLQSLLVVSSFYFYCLVGCAAGVCDLKSCGFLQLLFQRGLSVQAYWLAVWAIAGTEAALFSIISISSYVMQCQEFYRWDRVLLTFFVTFLQLLGASSLCLLYTVVLRSRFLVSVAIVCTTIVTMLLILLNRLLLSTYRWLKLPTAIIPFANQAEYQQCALLEDISPNSALTGYHSMVFVTSMFLPVAIIALTLYFDFVLKTGNGLRLAFNFWLDERFWGSSLHLPGSETVNMAALETQQTLPPGAQVQSREMNEVTSIARATGLSKEFTTFARSGTCCCRKKHTKALKNVSVSMHKGQVTAILGSNGAGKSALLNILSGRGRFDAGDVAIVGHSLGSPRSPLLLRGRLGVCPQAAALCQRLTVLETLCLLALSTGRYWRDCDDEALRLMKPLGLERLLDRPVRDLSRTQRRMLCTVMALLSPADLVILDEPIRGIDATSRLRLWQVLLEHRRSRSIVLSTQHIDEADVFADWMILLSKGSLRCAGSPEFFKTVYNCGMTLSAVVRKEEMAQLLLTALKTKCPAYQLCSLHGCRMELQIPRSELRDVEALAVLMESYSQFILSFDLTHGNLQSACVNRKFGSAECANEPCSEQGGSGLSQRHGDVAVTAPNSSARKTKAEERRNTHPDAPSVTYSGDSNIFRTLSAVLTINFKRSVRQKSKLCFKVIAPIVQLMSILGGALIESSMRSHSDYNRVALFSESAAFGRGICVADLQTQSSAASRGVSGSTCKLFFKQPAAPPEQFIVLYKSMKWSLHSWLSGNLVQERIQKHCTVPMEPCPIVYMRNWRSGTPGPLMLGIGVYIKLGEYETRNVTAATVSLFMRVLQHIGLSPDLRVQGIFDFRTTLLPLLGMYFHLVLLSTLPATFLNDLVEDGTTKVRNQLRVIGMQSFTYWFITCLVHWLQYSFLYVCSSLVLMTVMPSAYAAKYYVLWVFLPTLLLGLLCNQLLAYNVSALLNRASPTVSVGYLLYTLVLCLLIHVVQLHSFISQVMLFLVPQFASIALTFYGTRNFFIAQAYFGTADMTGTAAADLPQHSVAMAIVAMAVHLPLLLISLACIENAPSLSRCIRGRGGKDAEENEGTYCLVTDQDMVTQTLRIVHNPQSVAHILEARALSKEYSDRVKAVRCVTFGVRPGEVFGLIGPNDAGKTTVARLLTGQERPTSGSCEVVVGQEWLDAARASRQKGIGYCPQYNPLYDYITAREHLHFYSAVLGLTAARAAADVDSLIKKFGLLPHKDKMVINLSSGFRRRLSFAISLLGDPTVVILDDVSDGIDPEGKALIWDAIRSTISGNRSVLITSISLAEAEDLCDRVGVLCEGYLLSMGSIGDIFNTHGNGYKLELLFPATATEAHVDSAVDTTLKLFSGASLMRRLRRQATFAVPAASIRPLSATYHRLGAMQASLAFEQFSLRRLSLDEAIDQLLKQKDQLIVPETTEKISRSSSSSE